MHRILQHLRRDHTRLAQLLDLLGRQLDLFHGGVEPELDLLIDVLDYMENYADCVHHKSEDKLFDLYLSEHSEGRALIEDVKGQHKTLVGMTRSFRHALEGVVQGAVQRREAVEGLGRDYLALQRRHLETEEAEVFPLVEQALTDTQLDALEPELPDRSDPLFDHRLKERYAMLFRYLSGA
jgi:hemerythrin-like domain-containing protein